MKNPWMSACLSAANQAAGASHGLWVAEAQRQQQASIKEMTRLWTTGLKAGMSDRKTELRRRSR